MIEIISYEINKNNLTVGFKLNGFVVYSSLPYDESKSKEELLQLAYEQCKGSIDYELTQEEHSITTDLEGEEFIPETPKVISLKVNIPQRISFQKLTTMEELETLKELGFIEDDVDLDTLLEETNIAKGFVEVPLTTIAKDQYGENIEVDITYLTNYGDIEDNILTIPRVEEFTIVSVTVSGVDISDTVDISVFPYQEPMPAIPSELEVLDVRVTEIEQVVDTVIGGEDNV